MRNARSATVAKRRSMFADEHRSIALIPAVNASNATRGYVELGIADLIEKSPVALTVRDLADTLNLSGQTLYRMVSDQTIPFFTIRGSYRFDPKEIARWLRRRSVNGNK